MRRYRSAPIPRSALPAVGAHERRDRGRFVVERQIRGSAVGCMLNVNACCRQASTMDFRELTPHTIQ
ncbi:hypothetical protein EVAR_6545_1 [Eumeta japonica]|uniref:Uncharacterized protein n=1 Tax=Eumeta variegata TaxID=151549 RepID=A0A4C1SQV6_EUMVA|nr:hypothetical protein EVAR_6545_1 [Eumeta japonica]